MEEGYLALRWNNHNTIFTKILSLLREQEAYVDVSLACAGQLYPAHKFVLSTCSEYFKEMFNKNPCKHPIVFMKDVSTKDMESLLDFMYKGEVHVPQSDLGSLLRTAEALQVKGLAVPDDSPRGALQNALSTNPTDVTSVRSSHPAPKQVTTPLTVHGKRKRPPEPVAKDDPPKLTRRPEVSLSNGNPTRSMPSSMPELKRIRKEGIINNNNNNNNKSTAKKKESVYPHVMKREVSGGRSPVDSETHSGNDSSNRKVKIEVPDVVIKNGEMADAEDEGIAAEGSEEEETGEEEEEEEEEDEEGDEEEGRTMSEVDDTCDNTSLPNSDSSTYNHVNHNSALKIKEELLEQDIKSELLQVDLSEDGTQFIIGPGGFDSSSRASSLAGDDDRASESGSGQKKPFVCPLCGQAFTRRDNLANHIKTHTGDRPFMCQYCQKCFSRKDYLKQHERIHTGEKPYACEICGRAFTRKEGLTDHMRCHSDFKAFSCETCGKSFKQKCGLRFHKRNYKH